MPVTRNRRNSSVPLLNNARYPQSVRGINLILTALLMLMAAPVQAQNCVAPLGIEGDIILNTTYNVPQYCNGHDWVAFGMLNPSAGGSGCNGPAGVAGDLIYNSTYHVLQYCDGDDWRAVGNNISPSLKGPPDCPEIGDLCTAHGNIIFAGWHPITRDRLFIPPTDQERPGSPGSFTMAWKNALGTNDISSVSQVDGRVNHANRGGAIGDFPAFQACENLGLGGYRDWFLPSRTELDTLYVNRPALLVKGNITDFQVAFYWSSSELTINAAKVVVLQDGTVSSSSKTSSSFGVRCVRRE